MNEDFVTYELAVKLKEKGFDEPCYGYYHCNGGNDSFELCGNGDRDFQNSKNQYRVAAPTIPQVLKWLREEKRIDAGAVWDNRDGKWIGYINEMDMPDLVGEYVLPNTYDAYELAALAGIEYVLYNLI